MKYGIDMLPEYEADYIENFVCPWCDNPDCLGDCGHPEAAREYELDHDYHDRKDNGEI
jgi:hypothetical protein